MTTWDYWRLLNSIASFVVMIMAIIRLTQQWDSFILAEKFRWMSYVLLLAAGFYAPMEIVFWPHLQFRVPLLTFALVWAGASLVLPQRYPKGWTRG